MTTKLPPAPTPTNFADAWKKEVVEPAAQKVAGADGVIDGADASGADSSLRGADHLAADAIKNAAQLTGSATSGVSAFVDAEHQRALDAAKVAAGPDGRLSKADAEKLPSDLRMAFHYLRTGEVPAPTRSREPKFSQAVMSSVLAEYGLSDKDALIDKALELETKSLFYLNREELRAAAQALAATAPGGYDFSDNVVAKVMTEHGVSDRIALLNEATLHDADGNRYLRRSELEAAAKVLTGAVEIGIVSDIDKTLLPPHPSGAALPAPYPGIVTLLNLLEHGTSGAGKAGDTHYVTARSPDRVTALPQWFSDSGLPDGGIDTGVSPLPWVAQPEKVKDISAVFDANPGQKFVLFGDNSHRDPEAYREIVAKYPNQVHAAFIHRVKNAPDMTRFSGLQLIDSYAEAAAHLLQLGVIDEAGARTVMVAAQAEGLNITDAAIDSLIATNRPS
jgi:hypothetical protein